MSNPLDAPSSPSPQPETPIPETTDDMTPQSGIAPTASANQRLAIENTLPSDQSKSQPEQEEEEVHTLDLGEGNVIKLDKLGPMIINSDGTLSRIQNWQDLHPIEQERTVRLLVKKRNLVRLQKLDKENKDSDGTEEQLTALKAGSGQSSS
ncbi:uncharacterized protein I303_101528 [Kwoniella dejecticola CBS 10117]|uniref:Uncharacterized protein n=1 Tax=Kwoniella dejecticola CBS 10117 TaxID=1296121 RepID=A0A1A6ADH3_9TREE|nr:uncharacterized protein I303_02340 [Kwoniella dejecticola CBS 10117]OBR88121.1 hypothetical protein I303_02340 [Kwoniella dejecticola CBS 10117]